MKLKLGVATYAFLWEYTLEATLKQIADWGFRHVELMSAPPHVWTRALDRKGMQSLRKLFEAHGVELAALNPTFLELNLASPNPGFRQESITQTKETIRLAHELGAPIVVLIPGRRHVLVPQPFEETWQVAKQSIRECLGEAERYGIVLGIENAPSLFVERSDQLRRMVEEIASDYLRIVFDVANGMMCESLPDALDTVKDYLVHVHVSDCDGRNWAHLPVGMGGIDFHEIAGKLAEITFEGVSVIETTYLADPDGGVKESKRQLEAFGWHV